MVGEKRVGRLMKQEGIWGASRRRRGPKTTRRNADARPVVDLVERNFTADGPDQLWVADITYIPASAGFLYLAVVLDAWSRRVIGWAMATHLRTGARPRLSEHGRLAAPARASDPSLGPRHAIHVDRVRAALQGGPCPTLDGLGRRRVRQRALRELLRDARVRASRPQTLPDAGRGEDGRLRLHRGLLQPAQEALLSRPSLAGQLRTPPCPGGRRVSAPTPGSLLPRFTGEASLSLGRGM